MTDLLVLVGARPNFMKAASVIRAAEDAGLSSAIVHTGQHYDPELSNVFFDELGLPEPDVHLGVGSGTHAAQTARVMIAFDEELRRIDPSIVVVVGDVNSTLAGALVAVKERYRVAHVEAGLRTYDPWMPEEINRKLCDHVSSYLFTTSRDADENLLAEGIPAERISFVGNTMIDTLVRFERVARSRGFPATLGLEGKEFAVATLHRPETVEEPARLKGVIRGLVELSRSLRVVFPVHPRTQRRLEAGLDAELRQGSNVIVLPPLGYLDFLGLLADASIVLTDSGGIQEETTVLGVPCLTLRESTERPVTVTEGTNQVVGADRDRILEAARAVLAGTSRPRRLPELWDGRAGERIAKRLVEALGEGVAAASGVD